MAQKSNILAVDDTPANLEIIVETLTTEGYNVVAATSGERALSRLKSYQPDLILLDIQMPDMDGFEVCANLKANPHTANIPIIFITALSDTESIVKGLSAGAVDYISKPFQTAELLVRVKNHLQLRHVSELYRLEQEKTEELRQLNQSLSLTQFSMDSAADGIIWIGQDAKCLYANAAACTMLEYPREELMTLSVPDFDLEFSAQRWQEHWQQAKESKSVSIESRHCSRRGRIYPTDIKVKYLSFAEKEYLIAIFRDVSDRKRTEAALQLSEARATASFDQAAVGFVEVNMRTKKCVRVNSLFCNMLGYTSAELADMTVADITHPDDLAATSQQIKELYLGKKESFTIEKRYLRKNRTFFWSETTVYLIKLKNGEAIYSVGLVQDISERKRLAAERNAVEKKLSLTQFAVDNTAVGTFWINQQGQFIDGNNSACLRLGYAFQELTSLCVWDINPNLSQGQWPALLAKLKESPYQRFETLHLTKTGQSFPVEITSSYLEYDGDGYVFSQVQDISDRKRIEKSLLFTQYSIDNAADGILWLRPDGSLIYANCAANTMHGYSQDEMREKSVFDLNPDMSQESWQRHWGVIKQQVSFSLETYHQDRDGRRFPVEIVVNFLKFEEEEYNFVRVRDISIRKQLEAERDANAVKIQQQNRKLEQALVQIQKTQLQLVQQEKMSSLGNLVAGVAHEINNPIGYVGGNVSELELALTDLFFHLALYRQQASVAEITDHANKIDLDYLLDDIPKMLVSMENGCDRIRNISISLRTFSRSDQDVKESFSIHEGLDSTLLILKHRLKANQQRPAIEVIKHYHDDVPDINCYPGQLNQVFMNILANSIDALEENSQGKSYQAIETMPNQIEITTEFQDNSVVVSIRDNGAGMSEGVQAKIFDHLYTTKELGKGTGLGLAIVQQIVVDIHGGQIQVNSALNQGTEFVLKLPNDPAN